MSTEEEVFLLDGIRSLAFQRGRMRGVAEKRRVIQYGWEYSCCSQNARARLDAHRHSISHGGQ